MGSRRAAPPADAGGGRPHTSPVTTLALFLALLLLAAGLAPSAVAVARGTGATALSAAAAAASAHPPSRARGLEPVPTPPPSAALPAAATADVVPPSFSPASEVLSVPGSRPGTGRTTVSHFTIPGINTTGCGDLSSYFVAFEEPRPSLASVRHALLPVVSPNGTLLVLGVMATTALPPVRFTASADNLLLPLLLSTADLGDTWTCRHLPLGVVRYKAAAVLYTSPRRGANLPVFEPPSQASPAPCSLMCVIGGVQPGIDDPSAPPTDRVSCSEDFGVTWTESPPFPTSVVRATAVQVADDLIVLGGVRGQESSALFRAVLNKTTEVPPEGAGGPVPTRRCSLVGWEVLAPSSPFTGRYDIIASEVFDQKLGINGLWAGGGRTTVGGSPLRATDIWRTSDPSNVSEWTRVSGSIPNSQTADADNFERTAYIADARTLNGDPWSPTTMGPCNTTDEDDECNGFVHMHSADTPYWHIVDFSTGWASFLTSYVSGGTVFDGNPVGMRMTVQLLDPANRREPVAISFQNGGGSLFRSYNSPCYYKCPTSWYTRGCTRSPYDAVCRPCQICGPGTFETSACGLGGKGSYIDRECRTCRVCPPGMVSLPGGCNGTTDTLCDFDASARPGGGEEAGSGSVVRLDSWAIALVYIGLAASLVGTLAAVVLVTMVTTHALSTTGRRGDGGKGDVASAAAAGLHAPGGGSLALGAARVPSRAGRLCVAVARSWRLVWPVAGSLFHFVYYIPLCVALWGDARTRSIATVLAVSLAAAVAFNAVFLFLTARSAIAAGAGPAAGTGAATDTPKAGDGAATSSPAGLEAVFRLTGPRALFFGAMALLHPRIGLLLPHLSKAEAASSSVSAARAPSARSALVVVLRPADVHRWGLWATLVCDLPPLLDCLVLLGNFTVPVIAPAIVCCIVVSVCNVLATMAWLLTAYVRQGMLSKLTAGSAADFAGMGDDNDVAARRQHGVEVRSVLHGAGAAAGSRAPADDGTASAPALSHISRDDLAAILREMDAHDASESSGPERLVDTAALLSQLLQRSQARKSAQAASVTGVATGPSAPSLAARPLALDVPPSASPSTAVNLPLAAGRLPPTPVPPLAAVESGPREEASSAPLATLWGTWGVGQRAAASQARSFVANLRQEESAPQQLATPPSTSPGEEGAVTGSDSGTPASGETAAPRPSHSQSSSTHSGTGDVMGDGSQEDGEGSEPGLGGRALLLSVPDSRVTATGPGTSPPAPSTMSRSLRVAAAASSVRRDPPFTR
jgi:hypothetical protein